MVGPGTAPSSSRAARSTKSGGAALDVQVFALLVLTDGGEQRFLVAHLPDHGGDVVQPRLARSTGAPFAGHKLITPAVGPHENRLQDAALPDVGAEFGQLHQVK